MAKFIYLFRSKPEAYRSMSSEQMQQTMQKWMQWKDTLENSGHTKQLGAAQAAERFEDSLKLARTESEIKFFQHKLESCRERAKETA
jgi:hypothetical protein